MGVGLRSAQPEPGDVVEGCMVIHIRRVCPQHMWIDTGAVDNRARWVVESAGYPIPPVLMRRIPPKIRNIRTKRRYAVRTRRKRVME